MATPSAFTADMLKDMTEQLLRYEPRQSLLMTAGYKREIMKAADVADCVRRGIETIGDHADDEAASN